MRFLSFSKMGVMLNLFFCLELLIDIVCINKAVRMMSEEGTCIVRLGWEYEKKKKL